MELNHLAIIMDGNRRWALLNNRPSYEGHRFGADNLWKVIKDIDNYSINYLTLFVFSTENWKRSQKEILFLLALLEKFLDDLESKVEDNELVYEKEFNINEKLPFREINHHTSRPEGKT